MALPRDFRVPNAADSRAVGDRGPAQYRRVLVDWMCEIGEVFSIQKCTMHVAVGYLDRILQDVAVTKARLQLVAMCCLLIASELPHVCVQHRHRALWVASLLLTRAA